MSHLQEKITRSSYVATLINDWYSYLEDARLDYYRKYFLYEDHLVKAHTDDFLFIKTLGMGAFGRVMLVSKKSSGRFYAAKILSKKSIVDSKRIKRTLNEKNILTSIRFPFTVHLEYFCQDNVYLYFVMPLVEGGEIFMFLRQEGRFNEHMAKFYAAQVILALEYLHYLRLVHRDLKPENILLDKDGFVKLSDFGLCKRVEGRTYTFCGTPEYMAPEILLSVGYGESVDYWALGVLLYELNSGHTPFYSKNIIAMCNKIIEGNYMNKTYFSSDLKDIIVHLLQPDFTRRYGVLRYGIKDIKNHAWFKNIIWIQLLNKNVRPPFVPNEVPKSIFFEQLSEEPPLLQASHDSYSNEFENF